MKGFAQAVKKIKQARSIAIAGHINPDGDSIGSLLSLGLGLKKLGKRVYMLSADGVPQAYKRLPGSSLIVRRVAKKLDLAIAVDCSTKEMLGEAFGVFRKAGSILEIDHHKSRASFGDTSLVDPQAAAVGEIIYLLLKELRVPVRTAIAQSILTSLIVETNSFRLPNTRAFTFEICAELLKKGVDFYSLTNMVYWSKTRAALILTGTCLLRARFIKGGRIAWSIVKEKDFRRVSGSDEDVDTVADQLRSIQDVEIAVLFREKNRKFLRVSLRSKGKVNLFELAHSFNGGGHADSAGCTIKNNAKSLKEFLNRVEYLLDSKRERPRP